MSSLEFNAKNLENPGDVYSNCLMFRGLGDCHDFQRAMVKLFAGRTLNAACADDVGQLGLLGSINLDVAEHQDWNGIDLTKNRNFVRGSVFAIPFADEHFDTVVLGEFIEHCTCDGALEAILECRRVLKPGGHLILTFPLDGRPRDEQETLSKNPDFYDHEAKVTTYHRTWWSMKMQAQLRKQVRMVECARAALVYVLTCPLGGWGLVWQKLNER